MAWARVMSQGEGDGVGQGDDSIDGERALAWWLTDWGCAGGKLSLASTSLVLS